MRVRTRHFLLGWKKLSTEMEIKNPGSRQLRGHPRHWRLVRALFAALALAVTILPSQAQELLEPESVRTSRWQYAAQLLEAEGVASDIESLLTALTSHADPDVRAKAALILGERGDTAATPVLKAALNDPSPWVRKEAASALAHLGDSEGLAQLQEMMAGTEDLREKIGLALRLVRLSDFGGYENLVEGSVAYSHRTRITVASYLPYFFAMPDPNPALASPMEVLELLLRDADPRVRRETVQSLGLVAIYGGPLDELLEKSGELEVYDPDESVREAARLVQVSLRGTPSSEEGASGEDVGASREP